MNQQTFFQRMTLCAGLCAGLVIGSPLSQSQDPPSDSTATPIHREPDVLMQAKLTSSKKVLEGLLRRDFDSIARAAREMSRISKATAWPRPQDEVYTHFSNEFQRQCNQLESQANELNHDGAKFIYMSMTTTCINCHEYIRDSRRVAGLDDTGNVRPIPSQWPTDNLRR